MDEHQIHDITLTEGSEMTKRYRDQMTDQQKIGGAFGKDAILQVVNQEGAIGFRYYYGFDERGEQVLVLVALDRDGNDLVEGKIMERSLMCPPYCSTNNSLNS